MKSRSARYLEHLYALHKSGLGLAATLALSGSFALGQKGSAPPPPPPAPTPMQYTVPSEFDQQKKVFDSNGKPLTPQSAKETGCFCPL